MIKRIEEIKHYLKEVALDAPRLTNVINSMTEDIKGVVDAETASRFDKKYENIDEEFKHIILARPE